MSASHHRFPADDLFKICPAARRISFAAFTTGIGQQQPRRVEQTVFLELGHPPLSRKGDTPLFSQTNSVTCERRACDRNAAAPPNSTPSTKSASVKPKTSIPSSGRRSGVRRNSPRNVEQLPDRCDVLFLEHRLHHQRGHPLHAGKRVDQLRASARASACRDWRRRHPEPGLGVFVDHVGGRRT